MRYTLPATLLFLLAATGLRAQEIPSPYRYIEPTQSVGLFAGYLNADRGELGIGPGSGPMLGARYVIRFSGPVSGEVALGGISSERTILQRVVVGDSADLQPRGDVDALLLLGEAGLRFHLTGPRTWNGFAPFVSLTGGLIGDLAGESALEESIEAEQRVDFGPAFAVGVAAGTDWFLTERIALRVSAREYLWRVTAPEGLSLTQREEAEWTQNLGLTLGAALYF